MGKRKTTAEFIEEAKLVHGDTYDYSEVSYVSSETKVDIICKKHGKFTQTPHGHLKGQGCPKCGKDRKVQKNINKGYTSFINKSKLIYNNFYDYSKVDYKSAKTRICVICPTHGEFWVTPHNHIYNKTVCPKCTDRYIDTETFIKRAKEIHGDKYDYTNTVYIKSDELVEIVCKKHGIFKQRAIDHLCGHGCPKCGIEKATSKSILGKEGFIEKAVSVHGMKYCYDPVIYVNSKTKVKIICPEHGEFWQTPNDHLDGCGCPKCDPSYRLNTQTFIEKAISKHGNRFDYSKVNYVNSNTKVCIICPEHGEFWQLPSNHLSGQQCPRCKTKGQAELFRKLIEYFPDEQFQWEYRSEWLDKQIIDIYLEKYKIAIEYDGLQHYKPVKFFGGEKGFLIRQEADRRKEQKCLDNNVLLIRVRYGNIEKDFTQICNIITNRIKEYGNM